MELLTRIKELEDAFNKTTDSALQLMEINKEHQRINGELREEIERLNKTIEDIDTYIHLWKLNDIGEKTMLILNDILLIKNGMSDKVVRLKDSDKE